MGLSGSGKTTFAKKLAKDLDAVLFSADEIRNLTKFSDFSSNGRLQDSYNKIIILVNFKFKSG